MLVRRWVHKLTFKNLRQCVNAADCKALRCDLHRSAIGAELSLF